MGLAGLVVNSVSFAKLSFETVAVFIHDRLTGIKMLQLRTHYYRLVLWKSCNILKHVNFIKMGLAGLVVNAVSFAKLASKTVAALIYVRLTGI